MKNRRLLSSSVPAAVKAMRSAAQGVPMVPAHVRIRPGDVPFLEGILRARARDEWSEADLVLAGQLARVQADIEAESRALEKEPKVTKTRHGTPMANVRLTVLEGMVKRQLGLMRSLRMTGRVSGDSRDLAGGRRIEREARRIREQLIADEDLLA